MLLQCTNPHMYNINVLEAKLATCNEFILLDRPEAKQLIVTVSLVLPFIMEISFAYHCCLLLLHNHETLSLDTIFHDKGYTLCFNVETLHFM